MPKPQRFKVEEVRNALIATGGIQSRAAELLQCNRGTIADYLKKYSALREAYEQINEGILDLAEDKLYEAIKAGDIRAITFILRTKGRSRGYAERREVARTDSDKTASSSAGGREKLARSLDRLSTAGGKAEVPEKPDGSTVH